MSVYDSTHSASRDSIATKKAKIILSDIMKTKFKERGFKAEVKTEVPALFYKPYHSDLGIIIRRIDASYDDPVYHFFNIEIDGDDHKSKIHEFKDDDKAQNFLKHSGTITTRFDVGEIVGSKDKLLENAIFNRVWEDIVNAYLLTPIGSFEEKRASRNREFAISLK